MRAVQDGPGLHLQPLPAFSGELARTPNEPTGVFTPLVTAKIACSGYPERSCEDLFQTSHWYGVRPGPMVPSLPILNVYVIPSQAHSYDDGHAAHVPAYDTLSCNNVPLRTTTFLPALS